MATTPKLPPNQFQVALLAEVGATEPFMKDFLEVFDILGGTMIFGDERDAVQNATANILTDGLIPAFLELRKIRASLQQNLPLVDRYQLYEDLARKLWKSYKDLTQTAAEKIGFKIGFLYQDDGKFEAGLKKFREENPGVAAAMEEYFRETRSRWQNDLATFRNTFVEHQNGKREDYAKFYDARVSEVLFEEVWRAIVEILVTLLGLRMPKGVFIGETDPNAPGPKWPKRFRFYVEGLSPKG